MKRKCPVCNGKKEVPKDEKEHWETCPNCEGIGKVDDRVNLRDAFWKKVTPVINGGNWAEIYEAVNAALTDAMDGAVGEDRYRTLEIVEDQLIPQLTKKR